MTSLNKSGALIVFVTAPSEKKALEIAGRLLDLRLAACASISGPVRSVFRYKGEVCDEQEYMLIIKSAAENFERLSSAVSEIHGYDIPEIIGFPVTAAFPPYLDWLLGETARVE